MKNTPYSYVKHLHNASRSSSAYKQCADLIPMANFVKAKSEISTWDGYAATPLVNLTDIAAKAGVQSVLYKDESSRFGLGSFKALGGSYAVFQLAQEYETTHGSLDGLVVTTATDGNHGRSVAWGAKRLGIDCHIFIHAHVSEQRSDSMVALGAQVHRVSGNYDDSLVDCAREADKHGWQIVSDTSWDDYESVPLLVMTGYSVMAAEIVEQLDGVVPTHMFIPAGCGGLAGGMLAYLWQVWKDKLPSIVIVESEMSDCVYQSLQAQHIELVDIVEETVMAGLSCGEVSRIIWPLLLSGVEHVVTIADDGVIPMMQWLADPSNDDRPSIEGGECSAASLIALMAGCQDAHLKQSMKLTSDSVVLVLGTEGATDPDFYRQAINT